MGVPGIGKSRLVFELFETIRTGSFGLVYWRHGRSLPYGDGITYWALGEMVKAQAGILESDSPEQASEKLRRATHAVVADEAEADWVERHLRALAGLETDSTAGDQRGEAFAAWRRFFESLAEERPLVLVFEDLHWGDEALLDFVDYLVEWASGVPLLVVCTARPELLARRSGWGGGKVNSSTIQLAPLSEDETAALVHALLGRSADRGRPAGPVARARGRQSALRGGVHADAERATGRRRPARDRAGAHRRASRHAASPTRKSCCADAAVIGRSFWLGALGPERWTLEERLHALERVEFVRRERRSAVAGESEYSFRHALMRDVAYEQIPRAQRADKHRRAAEWIETLGRGDDHAEMLAHHYGAALEYARATGGDTGGFEERARAAFREAGDRAFGLNAFPAAARYYALAAELWPREDPEWPELLFSLARAYHVGGDERREQALEDARQASLAAGLLEHAAEADALLAEVWWYRRDRERCDRHIDLAAAQVAELPDSPAKAFVLSQISRYRLLADQYEEAIRIGEEALAMAERLGLDELRAHALNNIGTSRANLGQAEGIDALERSVELALALRSPEAARALNNLSAVVAGFGDFRRQGELLMEAVRVGEELGALSLATFSRATLVGNRFWTGEWDEGLRLAEAWIAGSGSESATGELGIRRNRARILLARDDVEGALEDVGRAVEGSRQMGEPQALFPALGAAIRIYHELGRTEEAHELAGELVEQMRGAGDWRILDFSFVAEPLGYGEQLRAYIEQLPPTTMRAMNLALVSGDYSGLRTSWSRSASCPPRQTLASSRRQASRARAVGRRPRTSSNGRSPSTARSVRPATSASARRSGAT